MLPQNKCSILRLPASSLAIQPSASIIPKIDHPTSAAERWANYVLRACKATEDPRTLGIWARQAAVSYTTLCESCRLIDIQPRYARDFVRVLRVVTMPSFDSGQLASFLDISDRRTLESIIKNTGFRDCAIVPRPVSVMSFLDGQRFISRENAGLQVIRDLFIAL